MKQKYNVWNVYLNTHTFNWGGKEWVVDGELGRITYPGDLPVETVCNYYRNGIEYGKEVTENDDL